MAEASQPRTNVFKKTFQQFIEDECMTMAAALAYYTIFSLPGFLVIVISVAGFFIGDQAVRARIEQEIQGVVGKGGVDQVDTMMKATRQGNTGIWPTLIGIAVLIFGATGIVAQLQYSLNRIWKIKVDPRGRHHALYPKTRSVIRHDFGNCLCSVGVACRDHGVELARREGRELVADLHLQELFTGRKLRRVAVGRRGRLCRDAEMAPGCSNCLA